MGGFLTGVDPGIRRTKTPTVNTFAAGVGFTAGSSTTISLTDSPGTEEHLTIFFDGVGQHRSTYSLSGSTVTFDTAIPTGVAEVEATYAPAVYAQLSTVSDNEITLAKMAGGTDGQIITYDASGDPVAVGPGNDGQVLTSTGAGSPPAFEALPSLVFTLGTVAETSSGSGHKVFSGIPSGVSIIGVNLFNVSLDNPDEFELQIGDSGGIETTGYLSMSFQDSGTTTQDRLTTTHAFCFNSYGSASETGGTIWLTLQDGSNNNWVSTHCVAIDSNIMNFGAGRKSLSGELTQLRFGAYAAGSWDSGSINIMYM